MRSYREMAPSGETRVAQQSGEVSESRSSCVDRTRQNRFGVAKKLRELSKVLSTVSVDIGGVNEMIDDDVDHLSNYLAHLRGRRVRIAGDHRIRALAAPLSGDEPCAHKNEAHLGRDFGEDALWVAHGGEHTVIVFKDKTCTTSKYGSPLDSSVTDDYRGCTNQGTKVKDCHRSAPPSDLLDRSHECVRISLNIHMKAGSQGAALKGPCDGVDSLPRSWAEDVQNAAVVSRDGSAQARAAGMQGAEKVSPNPVDCEKDQEEDTAPESTALSQRSHSAQSSQKNIQRFPHIICFTTLSCILLVLSFYCICYRSYICFATQYFTPKGMKPT
ncbi:uncharacterized protein [Lepisosteus oculatus]|uniref:uncharacterized protein n=1 Tax=Lepisosteus oculatus TaxID=7918 RepID=UPI0035F4FF18